MSNTMKLILIGAAGVAAWYAYKIYTTVKNIKVSFSGIYGIKADNTGFGAISFENIGADNAMINNVIPLDNTGIARTFGEKPYCRIDSDFIVTFSGNDPDRRVLVVETYYTEER